MQADDQDDTGRLRSNLSRIVLDLREALSASQYGQELARLAHTELPDAQHRLNRVIELTEAAADTCLTAVETAMPLTRRIRSLTAGNAPLEPDDQAELGANAEQIEQCLSEVLMAQGFQDITGQIIRRVTRLVAELEDTLRASGVTPEPEAQAATADHLNRGRGPAVAGVDNALERQQDVDDLLGQLGI